MGQVIHQFLGTNIRKLAFCAVAINETKANLLSLGKKYSREKKTKPQKRNSLLISNNQKQCLEDKSHISALRFDFQTTNSLLCSPNDADKPPICKTLCSGKPHLEYLLKSAMAKRDDPLELICHFPYGFPRPRLNIIQLICHLIILPRPSPGCCPDLQKIDSQNAAFSFVGFSFIVSEITQKLRN